MNRIYSDDPPLCAWSMFRPMSELDGTHDDWSSNNPNVMGRLALCRC